MYNQNNPFLHKETTCVSLLSELETIWDEIGEPESERDKMLHQLEKECLEVYRRKVDQASHCRARMRQAVTDSEAELAQICAALGERPVCVRQQCKQGAGNLKKELEAIMLELEEMRKRKSDRRNRFIEVLDKIHNISKDIYISTEDNSYMKVIDESDLSLQRLDELQSQLLALDKEKSGRLKLVLDHLNSLKSLCIVLGVDFRDTIRDIQPTLDDSSSTKNINSDTIERLSAVISSLKDVKIQRIRRLQDLAATMVELWTLMDTPIEEQKMFHSVTRHLAASENEFTESNILSLDFINFAEAEVLRLQQMKSSKMKEVILKKKLDLEDLQRRAHMVAEAHSTMEYPVEAIDSRTIDPSFLLEQIELQISMVKEEAFSRKDILEKVQKWLAACEEESWLEEYTRDDNRYNSGRGTHLILKRAEKARVIVNKIPAMVETLCLKARAWEEDRRAEFIYDGVRLLSMLEQYNTLKHEKEKERQRQRDQRKLQGQLIAEQEVLFGSKPSPITSGKKVSRTSTSDSNKKRFSHLGVMLQTPNSERTPLSSHSFKKSNSAKYHTPRNQQHGSGFGAPSSGNRNIRITGLPAAHHSSFVSNAHITETTPVRKPLSPVTSAYSSNANAAANIQVQGITPNLVLHRTPPSDKTPVGTPQKTPPVDDNKTPKMMPIPMPTTPPTISAAMQTSTTPATSAFVPHHAGEIEYSFEEKRAGVVLPITPEKPILRF